MSHTPTTNTPEQSAPVECNSETGITVGLIDSLIAIANVIVHGDHLYADGIDEALKDLWDSDNMKRIMNIGELSDAKECINEKQEQIDSLVNALGIANKILSSQPIPSLGWVKAKDKRPAEGKDGEILTIKPISICHSYEGLPKLYTALVYMGKYDGGLAWHWHEGPSRAYATKIAAEDWDKIEYLEESLLPVQPEPILGWTETKVKEACAKAMSKGWHLGWDDHENNRFGYDQYGSVDEFTTFFAELLQEKKSGQPSIEPDAPINDGWISVDTPPEIMKDQTYSENVFVVWEGKVEVMAHCSINDGEETGRVWCNCYGDINGEPQYDADYHPTFWREIPKPPISVTN